MPGRAAGTTSGRGPRPVSRRPDHAVGRGTSRHFARRTTRRSAGYDFFPTFCQWAGIPASQLPPGIEGGSLVGLFATGQGNVTRPREELVFHFPHYQGEDGPQSALLLGDYKLMKFYEDNRLALFEITADISEQRDLAQTMPAKATDMDALLTRYLREIDAQMAVPNPQYDPNRTPTPRKVGGGGKNKPGRPAKPKRGRTN